MLRKLERPVDGKFRQADQGVFVFGFGNVLQHVEREVRFLPRPVCSGSDGVGGFRLECALKIRFKIGSDYGSATPASLTDFSQCLIKHFFGKI